MDATPEAYSLSIRQESSADCDHWQTVSVFDLKEGDELAIPTDRKGIAKSRNQYFMNGVRK